VTDPQDFPQAAAFAALRAAAMGLPEAHEAFPWGECAVKVRGKTFLFTRNDATGLHLSMKLPQSREFALEYPFTEPTGYGLGRSGWVSASFPPGETPPLDVLEAWVRESYRAVAPKTLLKAAGLL
jgi:predicted DNA-binding protein (MmcQ/YjbR family)